MINGDPHEFVDHLYSGQDTVFVFHGVKYWFQGYTVEETKTDHMEIFQYQPSPEPTGDYYLWTCDADSMEKCLDAFLDAPIFDGKCFWDVESEIEWVDD